MLVVDEISQIGPRQILKLLELQAKTGMTIKMLGDREQAQAIEAGDAMQLLQRALPKSALPELLTTVRQRSERGREIAGLFREGDAATALSMKRGDGHAMLLGGDRGQVVAQIADHYISRRDILLSGGAGRSITVSAPTNEDVAEIGAAIRERLKARGEIGQNERSLPGGRSDRTNLRPSYCCRRSCEALPQNLGDGRWEGQASREQWQRRDHSRRARGWAPDPHPGRRGGRRQMAEADR